MRVIHIIFCSLLSIGSAQIPAGADSDALKNALGALTPAQIQAILGTRKNMISYFVFYR